MASILNLNNSKSLVLKELARLHQRLDQLEARFNDNKINS